MITKSILEQIKECTKTCTVLSLDTLTQLGLHIGDIAYLIETGKLVSLKNGYYEYQNVEKPEVTRFQTETTQFSNPNVEVLLSLLSHNEKKRIEINTSDSDWILLEEKSKILEQTKGILILKAMPEERRHKIYKLVRGISCMFAFPIGTDSENKKIVLKFHKEEQKDIKKLMNEANEAYQKERFQQSINAYLEALGHLRKPSPYIYTKLGFAYMKISQKKKAILYLTVANGLYKKDGKPKDFTSLIERLKGNKQVDGDNKPFVLFFENDFQNNLDDYYGLEAIEEMTAFITSGKRLEEVATMFSLTEEQIMLLMLVLARNCYTNGDYKLGDSYLKQVEKRKNKTEQVKRLLDEIRKNKKIYKNRRLDDKDNNDTKTFVL